MALTMTTTEDLLSLWNKPWKGRRHSPLSIRLLPFT
nr:MAG TPA: hypothetical protein [Caudoviricetes sp.]